MTDLRTLIADLELLAQSYARRARANGGSFPSHADNDYLIAQGARFDEAAWQIKLAVAAAKQRVLDATVEDEVEDEDPTAGFLVEAAWDRIA